MLSVLPDAVVTTLGTPVTIHVLANDGGSGLTVTSFSNPAHGSVMFNADQSFTYTPTAGFVGADSFAYTVRDAQGTPSGAEVTITVAPNDGATRATADYVEMIAGGDAIIPVLDNDLTANGPLRLIAISVPGHGATNVLASQSIRYVPQTGFVGIDSFTYTVIDATGTTTSATVTVKVLAANSAPVAHDDVFTLEAGRTTVLAILANDGDPDGDPLQVVSYSMPSHGSLAFNPDKTFSYTPDAGYQGADQFAYTIRDNRGASASASVRLAIVETAEQPTAADDHVATEAGVPVTIDVLGNDELPAGQQIRITAVTLPFKGKLVFNLDGTITYTPDAGFVGFDDFTYTIGNGLGGTAKATVTIEVTPATASSTYANGYAYRRRIVLPAQQASQMTVENIVILVAEEAVWLKTEANGGKVAFADGADLRFEDISGLKLDHEIEHYDPATGKLLAWLRLPAWTLVETRQLLLYYGNSGLQAAEPNPGGVWQGYLARWRLPSGSDATGNGHNLTPQGVSPGELLGSAASFSETERLTLDDTSWLDGLAAFTVQALIKADPAIVGGNGQILVQGGGTGSGTGITLSYIGMTSDGVPGVVQVKAKCTDGNAYTLSAANRQSSERQLLHGTWRSGFAPDLFIDGTKSVVSRSATRYGTTAGIDGPLELGGNWVGLIDEARITDRQLPADWIAFEARNMLAPKLSYGLSAEETMNDDTGNVVAIPFQVDTAAGNWVGIDVISRAFVPTGAEGAPSIHGVSQPTHGSVSVIDGEIRYSPTSGFVGTDNFTYTLALDGKLSSASIAVTVQPPVSTGQGEEQAELPPPLRTFVCNKQSELDARKNASIPGDEIVIAFNNAQLGTISRAGSAQYPIVYRANSLARPLGGNVSITGDHVRLHGFAFGTRGLGNVDGADVWVVRCSFSGGSSMVMRARKPGLRVWHSSFDGPGATNRAIAFDTGGDVDGTQGHVYRCLFTNWAPGGSNATEVITVGFSSSRTSVESDTVIEECLFRDCNQGGQEDETIAIKSSLVTVRNCTFERTRWCQVRHGRNNLIEGCVHADSTNGGFRIRDYNARLINCKTLGPSGTEVFAGDSLSGEENPSWPSSGIYPRADRCKIYNHEAVSSAPRIGATFSSPFSSLQPATLTEILGNRGLAPTLEGDGRQTATNPSAQWTSPAPVTYLPPIRLAANEVGPNA